jgi:ATP-dependent DNA ligase
MARCLRGVLVARKKPTSSLPRNLVPMEARSVATLPVGPSWQYEPKWDGFRCLALRDGSAVELRAKSGNSLSRYFPEVVTRLRSLPPKRFVLDGELAVPVGAALSFDALQMRLHPAASRIRKLSVQTPAIMILFDCLATPARRNLLAEPLRARRAALEELFESFDEAHGLVLSPFTTRLREAQAWLDRAGGSLDGVVAKESDAPYQPGERAMLKVKRLRTADCVVGGFRYGTGTREVGSLLLGLYDDEGLLHHVGFTSSIPKRERAALTKKLEKLRAAPGFTGKSPGAPSRWSTERSSEWQPLKPKLVAEVCYDHVTEQRFRHGTKLLRWRPDKAPRQCTFDQLEQEARPAKLIRTILRAHRSD